MGSRYPCWLSPCSYFLPLYRSDKLASHSGGQMERHPCPGLGHLEPPPVALSEHSSAPEAGRKGLGYVSPPDPRAQPPSLCKEQELKRA